MAVWFLIVSTIRLGEGFFNWTLSSVQGSWVQQYRFNYGTCDPLLTKGLATQCDYVHVSRMQ